MNTYNVITNAKVVIFFDISKDNGRKIEERPIDKANNVINLLNGRK